MPQACVAAVGGATASLTAPTSLVLATLREDVQLLPKKPAVTLQGRNSLLLGGGRV